VREGLRERLRKLLRDVLPETVLIRTVEIGMTGASYAL
jgi:hypothetical protein